MTQFQILFQALGFTLVHFCWQGAIIAGLVKLITLSVPNLRPRARYALSLAALLAMAAVAVLTFAWEQVRLSQVSDVPLDVLSTASRAAIAKTLDLKDLMPWLDAAWAGGVLFLSLRMLSGLWAIRQLAAHAQAVPDAIAARFARQVQAAGLGPVRLRLHPGIDGPFVVGLVRAVVYLPLSAVSALTPDQLDAVLAHELEHIRRADYAWNLLQSVLETLFFYHPAVWWLGKTMREQRELACDDAAVTACRDPLTYATALLCLEERRRAQPHLAMALNGNETGPSLLSRIGRILNDSPKGQAPVTPRSVPRPALLAAPLVVAMLAVFAVPAAQVAAHTEAQKKAPRIVAPDSVGSGATDTNEPALAPQAQTQDDTQASDESPAPEATDADVEPKDFWSGRTLTSPGQKDATRNWSQSWKVKADKVQTDWSNQSVAWVKGAQDWAKQVSAKFNDSDARAKALDGIRQGAEDARRQAEAIADQGSLQARSLRAAAEQLKRQADDLQREMDHEARDNDAQARRQERDQERAAAQAERQAERQAALAQRNAERLADARARSAEKHHWTIEVPDAPEAAEPAEPAEAAEQAEPAEPAAPAPAARPAPAPAPTPAMAPLPPMQPMLAKPFRISLTAPVIIHDLVVKAPVASVTHPAKVGKVKAVRLGDAPMAVSEPIPAPNSKAVAMVVVDARNTTIVKSTTDSNTRFVITTR